jgi:hypothetical protein
VNFSLILCLSLTKEVVDNLNPNLYSYSEIFEWNYFAKKVFNCLIFH